MNIISNICIIDYLDDWFVSSIASNENIDVPRALVSAFYQRLSVHVQIISFYGPIPTGNIDIK